MNQSLKQFCLLTILVYSANTFSADLTTGKIEVLSSTPLPSVGISINQLPSNIQTAKSKDIEKSQALDISAYMNENLAGVNVNDISGNPFQINVNYHGFTASPLLGTPQGLSVYMDGVRVNEPFGDVVNWYQIPKNAINSMQLYSGSNPLFGLNTLGGAISIQTKDGRNNPGGAIQLTGGSWGRKIGEFEYGGVTNDNSVDYFLAGTWFDEEGWRQHSPSDNKQFFGKLGWRNDKTDIKLTYSYTEADLNGNGLTPASMLKENYERIYTYPDNTSAKNHFLNLQAEHFINNELVLSGNLYYRNIKNKTLNGDFNNDVLPSVDLSNTGLTVPSPAGTSVRWLGQTIISTSNGDGSLNVTNANLLARCMANLGATAEPGEKCTGFLNRTSTSQENIGLSTQLSGMNKLFERNNTYILGAGFDFSKSHFTQSSELGSYNIDGSITGVNKFLIAANDYVSNDALLTNDVNLKGKTDTASIFAADTFEVKKNLNITASGRYNYTIVKTSDQNSHYDTYIGNAYGAIDNGYDFYKDTIPGSVSFTPTQLITAAQGSSPTSAMKAVDYLSPNSDASLSGRHIYHRFNPSIGLTFDPVETMNFYGSYSEGSRAPTPIELGCANPDQGCKLPNSMSGDPDLKQVVSKTWGGGVRAKFKDLSWGATAYTTTNSDDIQFIGKNTSGDGYFNNVGETRRRGIDLSFSENFGRFNLSGNYSYIDATYQSEQTRTSNANGSGQLYCSKNNGTDCTILAADAAGSKPGYTSTSTTQNYLVSSDQLAKGITEGGMAVNNNYTYWRTITINKGDRLPLIPEHMLKLNLSYRVNEKFDIGASTLTLTDSIIMGNDNGGASNGKIGGYTTMNLTAAYKPSSEWLIFAKVNNVFDREYATSGQLGMNGMNSSGVPGLAYKTATLGYAAGVSEAFLAPGAPRAAWVGIRWEFGGKKSSGLDRD